MRRALKLAGRLYGRPEHGAAPFSSSAPRTYPYESAARERFRNFLYVALPAAGVATLGYGFLYPDEQPLFPTQPSRTAAAALKDQTLTNWSATHEAKPRVVYQPETTGQIEHIVSTAHKNGSKLRVVGSALSPNGLGLPDDGADTLSMALMDKVLWLDPESRQVTVQAGCRVQALADWLRPRGLTLQNYASIREQQVGGFTQVGAHGTGAAIPPVDEQVVAMTLVTPGQGTLQLSNAQRPGLFKLARLGLGALGVVSEVTLQCVPSHVLLERTFTASVKDVKKNHARWLSENRHLRYMWLPYTNTVVVVQCNKAESPEAAAAAVAREPPSKYSEEQRLAPLRALLQQSAGKKAPAAAGAAGSAGEGVEGLSATQLRDRLLALAPLDKNWVAKVNRAEAEYWKRSSGVRSGWSDEILGFDCGGQQWVLETAFPVGDLDELKLAKPGAVTKDVAYIEDLMREIERSSIPAHAPIEQRWTGGSGAPMSPAAGPPGSVHSWVGVIMYLPTEEDSQRREITEAFRRYAALVHGRLSPKYGAATHWAKLEVPQDGAELAAARAALAARFPLAEFNAARAEVDPKNVLANSWLDTLVGGSRISA